MARVRHVVSYNEGRGGDVEHLLGVMAASAPGGELPAMKELVALGALVWIRGMRLIKSQDGSLELAQLLGPPAGAVVREGVAQAQLVVSQAPVQKPRNQAATTTVAKSQRQAETEKQQGSPAAAAVVAVNQPQVRPLAEVGVVTDRAAAVAKSEQSQASAVVQRQQPAVEPAELDEDALVMLEGLCGDVLGSLA